MAIRDKNREAVGYRPVGRPLQAHPAPRAIRASLRSTLQPDSGCGSGFSLTLRAQFTRIAVRTTHILAHRFRTAFAAVHSPVLQNSVKSAIPSALPRETWGHRRWTATALTIPYRDL